MNYWKTGTCTLTQGSAIVTGQGTNWLNSGLRKDDRIESNIGQMGTIASVNSPTQITLDKAWAGTSQAAAAYKGWFTPEDVFLEGKARQALSMAGDGNLSALMELDGTGGNKLISMTGAHMMALVTATARGRAMLGLAGNADTFGSYLRLTDASSAAMAPIMGAMSNGALQDFGSNANGYYARFANGLLVCVGHITMDITNAQSISGLYQGNRTWSFPSQFGRITNLVGFTSGQVGNAWGSSFNIVNNQLCVVRAFATASLAGATVYAAAIGRWD